jgi:1-phosphatidylinositol-4-phosphate 5-kinase
MSKEEAERVKESRAMGKQSVERTPSIEKMIQAAEKEAAKDVSVAHSRTLATVRDPADANNPGPSSTLPIVDEAGEASSVDRHSQHSRHGPPIPEKGLPLTPQHDGAPRQSGGDKGKQTAQEDRRFSWVQQ